MSDPRRKRTADFHRKSVVMLDHLVDRYAPDAWPVSAVRDTEEEAGELRQHDGAPPVLVSRRDYAATPGGALALVDVRTGETLPARVYVLERRADA